MNSLDWFIVLTGGIAIGQFISGVGLTHYAVWLQSRKVKSASALFNSFAKLHQKERNENG